MYLILSIELIIMMFIIAYFASRHRLQQLNRAKTDQSFVSNKKGLRRETGKRAHGSTTVEHDILWETTYVSPPRHRFDSERKEKLLTFNVCVLRKSGGHDLAITTPVRVNPSFLIKFDSLFFNNTVL